MLRREKEEPIRTYGLYEPKPGPGKTRKGRPAESYTNYVAGLISKVVKMSSEEIETAAQNRNEWKKLVPAHFARNIYVTVHTTNDYDDVKFILSFNI